MGATAPGPADRASPNRTSPRTASRGLSRRGLFAATAGAATAIGGGLAVATASDRPLSLGTGSSGGADLPESYPFHGVHQAGIVTPAQDRLHFAAFDVTTDSRERLVDLLTRWTTIAADLTRGVPVSSGGVGSYDAPPLDTGEAADLPASRLTVTIGFGPSLFRDAEGRDRFGLATSQPRLLERLPHFPGDDLDPLRSDGDLCVQACADDPQVAVHAVRNLARAAFGTAAIRWAQLGYGRTSSTSTSQTTPRNLFGFKDGTANLKAEDGAALAEHVWVKTGDDPAASWLVGGSYLVARRIRMHVEPWDRTPLREQEAIIGRDRRAGAPLSGGGEFTEPDFAASGGDGLPLIPEVSHVRLAHPDSNGGARILRRGYNFTDGSDALGRLDAGLFFLAFVRNPSTQFVPMQNRLAKNDVMMEYIEHTGSALFAVPPGVGQGEFVGQALFG